MHNVHTAGLHTSDNYKRQTTERETKWHLELGQILGVPFWNKIYNQVSDIKYDNALELVQYQVATEQLVLVKIGYTDTNNTLRLILIQILVSLLV